MKKLANLLTLTALLLVAILTFSACSSYPSLKKAFEKEGYTENSTLESVAENIKADLEKKDLEVTLHLLTASNKITSVLIIEFKSTDELVNAYKDSDTIKGLVKDIKDSEDVKEVYNSLKDNGFAKGNCFAIPLSLLHVKDITEIVKNA